MKLSNAVVTLSLFILAVGPAWGKSHEKPPADRISEEKAETIARTQAIGTVESHELEHEGGKWIYSFDIRGADKLIHEVQVEARTGKVVSNKTETPKQEAAEKKAEKAAN